MNKELLFKNALIVNVFIGAFLLFMIQPLIGKIFTPIFGGGSQIWILCLFFFQFVLLCGYSFAYLLSKLPKKLQIIVYSISIISSLFIFKFPAVEQIEVNSTNPISSILMILLANFALPLMLVSSVSTTIQNWYKISTNKEPYFLYAISNIGSLLALLSFPFIIEPNLTVSITSDMWLLGYWALGVCIVSTSLLFFFNKQSNCNTQSNNEGTQANNREFSVKNLLLWVALSCLGTSILLAFTSHLTHDIAPIPLLWVFPLGLYLFTFVSVFGKNKVYNRKLYIFGSFLLIMLLFISKNPSLKAYFTNFSEILTTLILMLFLCMVCHGELYELRPNSKKLPIFYLSISFGGALGGFLISIASPILFNNYLEHALILTAIFSYLLFLVFKHKLILFYDQKVDLGFRYFVLLVISVYAIKVGTCEIGKLNSKSKIVETRNFYGAAKLHLNVQNRNTLYNGRILHGYQLIDEKTKELLPTPTAYYGSLSAFGIVYDLFKNYHNKSIKMGIIGLGTGTQAIYGKKGDIIDFFEIDPKIIKIANEHFSFIKNSKAKVNFILGDGRLNLAKQRKESYDLLVVDAFSSDAIPVHLLTKEALELYMRKIKKDGLLIIHISNKYVDLKKLLESLSIDLGLNQVAIRVKPTSLDPYSYSNHYAFISKSDFLKKEIKKQKIEEKYNHIKLSYPPKKAKVDIWTDNFSNIFTLLK